MSTGQPVDLRDLHAEVAGLARWCLRAVRWNMAAVSDADRNNNETLGAGWGWSAMNEARQWIPMLDDRTHRELPGRWGELMGGGR